MSAELMNTKEVSKYLDIHEKQVYLLIKGGKIPCSRVTGKWIFPKKLIDEWIESSAHDGLQQARKKVNSIEGALLAAGSNDPVLDMLFSSIKRDHPSFNIFSASTGSLAGLQALNSGLTDIAFSHLYDSGTGDYNVPYLKQHCPDHHPVVVNLFYRQIGFLVTKAKAGIFKGWESLTKKNIRFINRQSGSGIRILLDQELETRDIAGHDIPGYDHEVFTHLEVGLSLVSGEAGAASSGRASSSRASLPPPSPKFWTLNFSRLSANGSTWFSTRARSFSRWFRPSLKRCNPIRLKNVSKKSAIITSRMQVKSFIRDHDPNTESRKGVSK